MAKCPHTRITIPECCCSKCLEEQVRRAAPALLEKERTAPAKATAARRNGRLAA